MIIGFDFDNTIINYSKSFTKLAKLKNLVPEKINKDKISIRNYLRKNNIEDEWTILQGEVYGKRELSPLVGLQKKAGKGGGARKDNRGPRRRK